MTRRTVVANEEVVCAELDDEAILLNVGTGIYYGLNSVGTRIWQLLAQGFQEDAIVEKLLAEYEVDSAQLRGDVAVLLRNLVERDLARVLDDDD